MKTSFGLNESEETVHCLVSDTPHGNAMQGCNQSLFLFDPCRNICVEDYQVYLFDDMQNNPVTSFAYGKVYPFLVVVTVLSNIFIALVLSRKHMRTPTNLVLLHMAYADLAVALFPFPFMFFWHVLKYGTAYKNELSRWWCYAAMYTTDAMPPWCHNVAIWLTVLLAVQRYMCIRFPMSGSQFWTPSTVTKATVVIVLVSGFCAMPKFLDIFAFRTIKFEVLNNDGSINASRYKCLFKNTDFFQTIGPDVYYSSYYWCRVILFVLIPSILLVVFSLLLVGEIRKAQQRQSRLIRHDRPARGDKSRTNLMLLVVVTIFLVVNLPQGLVLSAFVLSQITRTFHLAGHVTLMVTVIDNMLILGTYPINFAVYCCMSSAFRATLKQLFRRGTGPRIPRKVNETVILSNVTSNMQTVVKEPREEDCFL